MPKCPDCFEEIDRLELLEIFVAQRHLTVDNVGNLLKSDYVEYDDYEDLPDILCPECNALLFQDEKKAAKFLSAKI